MLTVVCSFFSVQQSNSSAANSYDPRKSIAYLFTSHLHLNAFLFVSHLIVTASHLSSPHSTAFSCLAGFGGLSPHNTSVAGLTGTYTTAGLAVAHGHWILFGQKMAVVFFFATGAMFSAIINPRPKPYVLAPTYGITFLLGSVLLVFALLSAAYRPDSSILFWFAAAANGLQNGVTSMVSQEKAERRADIVAQI
jgi:hypothetical protein